MKAAKNTKKYAQQIHFRKRLWERYKLNADEVRDDIINQIRYQKAERLYWQSHRVRVYGVYVGDRRIIVVYDKERKELVTALPLREVEKCNSNDGMDRIISSS